MFDMKKIILDSVSANMKDIPKSATLEQMEAFGSEVVEGAEMAYAQIFGGPVGDEVAGD